MRSDTAVDAVVIGAGVIGAALAQRLAASGKSVLVLEKFDRVAEGITSRNSGVIHSGIYYPPQSLKAKLCVQGKELLYAWAKKKGVAHAMTGKLIVAVNPAENEQLEALLRNAQASGARGLELWADKKVRAILPHLSSGLSAIFARETGIIEPYAFTRSLLDDAEINGAQVLTRAEVLAIVPASNGGYVLETTRGAIESTLVFNAAGVYADLVARLAGVGRYKVYPCRGDYFRLKSDKRFPHLIYPVKAKGDTGLGIHLTIDLGGGYRLGPDAEYVDEREDFSPRLDKLEKFRASAEKLLGPLSKESLSYDQCGIRPKLRSPKDTEEKDFIISQDKPGFINLVGIESPGLTSALAIADYALSLL